MSGPVEVQRATDNPEVAEAMLRAEGASWNVGLAALSERPFSFSVHQLIDADIAVSNNSAQGVFIAEGTTDVFSVLAPLAGRFDWDRDGHRGHAPDGPVLMHPDRPMRAHVDSLTATNVYVSPEVLTATARRVYGDDDIVVDFSSPLPLDQQRGEYYAQLVRFTNSAIEAGGFQHDLTRAALTRNLTVGMLECFALTGDREKRTASAARRGRLYHGGVEYLRAHASLAITADDAAAALDCSRAELDTAFQAHAGMPAQEYLLRLRLSAAHDDLLMGDVTTLRISDVAGRWGFSSAEAFARRYERSYGRSPLETLLS
jgi:AraC-like DNA-binding protein